MNKRRWPFFILLFLVLSAGLFGVRWKQEHPTVTPHDEEVRRRFLQAKEVEVSLVVNDADGYSVHRLSNHERKEMTDRFWLSSKVSGYNLNYRTLTVGWGKDSQLEFINLGDKPSSDIYYDAGNGKRAVSYNLHPVTSRYLRRWLASRPKFERKTK